MSGAQGNAVVIRALLAEIDGMGVREFCVCAGARNAPLLDVLPHRSFPSVLRTFYEERSAAFFALGRVMQTRRPVAVVTTSGTAVAELFPAVMEAYYQALPLVVVTADRPSRYHGSGAPQAVEQTQFFGLYTPTWCEMEFLSGQDCRLQRAPGAPGPVHINVRLEEGLLEERWSDPPAPPDAPKQSKEPLSEDCEDGWNSFWASPQPGVVLAGALHPSEAKSAAEVIAHLGWPVVAEATANLHDVGAIQPLLQKGGESALRAVNGGRVLRLGGVPSWRWWRDLDGRDDVPVLNISTMPFRGLARTQNVTSVPWHLLKNALRLPPAASSPDRPDRLTEVTSKLDEMLRAHPHSETAWMRHLSQVIGAHATVLLGNSLPIREWNLAAGPSQPGTQFFANRGANGIDGLISSWLGVGAESDESWLIVGDLSALYDLGAPWILPQLRKAKRRIVVINNGGGDIFSRVPWLKGAGAETKQMMKNPHAISFEPWARMWGMDYRLLTDASAMRDDDAACAVWEVRPDAAQTEAFWSAWQK